MIGTVCRDTGHLRIVNRRLYLPTGQPILDNPRGLGLKAGVDARSPNQAAQPSTSHNRLTIEVLSDLTAFTGEYVTEADAD